MDLMVSLVSWSAFIICWVTVNKKMKGNSSAIKRHIIGFIGGGLSFILIIALALMVGIIDSEKTAKTPIKSSDKVKSEFNFKKMIHDRNDFSEERGTLKIISESPLVVELLTEDIASQSKDIKKEDVNRAIIYGIYRTFIHTNEDQINITAYPLDIISLNPRLVEENHSIKVNIFVTREQALQAVKTLIPSVESFDDLTEEKMIGDMKIDDEWTNEFRKFYWNNEGQEKLISILKTK